jgi:DNA polymerase (family 10)
MGLDAKSHSLNLIMIDNYYIADQFSLLSKLMEIHAENSFKTKSYSIAAFNIEKLPEQLTAMPPEKIITIKGFGESTARKIDEIIKTGELKAVRDYIEKTPPGVIEMLNIKGIGPKKISTIWKDMGLESVGELLYACEENRLSLYKGFGAKTQETVKEAIEFYQRSQGSHLYAEVETYAWKLDQKLKEHFSNEKFEFTGAFRRQLEIINELEWITTCPPALLENFFTENNFSNEGQNGNVIAFKGQENVLLKFRFNQESTFYQELFCSSCSETFLDEWNQEFGESSYINIKSEEEVFSNNNLPFIPAYAREKKIRRDFDRSKIVNAGDINALIHSHSKWSDGAESIETMARECIRRGWEFMVISDHSKTAIYANGLTEERIIAQHGEIEELNEKLKPFKIFKSIECDILNDGTLDYSHNVLSTFDLVIASVHANLKMTEEKAMMRLLRAIENPYTTILGHMTGRLLLSRPGYPVDHKKIIEASAKNQVAIELNAHPRRLDMGWQWIDDAVNEGVYISIDPDAHSLHGFDDVRYGALVAQKAALPREKNLSSFSLKEFEEYLRQRKINRH